MINEEEFHMFSTPKTNDIDGYSIAKIMNYADGFDYHIMMDSNDGMIFQENHEPSLDISRKSAEYIYSDAYRLAELSMKVFDSCTINAMNMTI